MRPLLLAVLAVALAALPACKNPCLALAEKICDCEKTSIDRANCVQRATDEAAQRTVTDADKTVCTGLVDQCDCHLLDTTQGKKACGLSR